MIRKLKDAFEFGIEDVFDRLLFATVIAVGLLVSFYAIGTLVVLVVGHSISR